MDYLDVRGFDDPILCDHSPQALSRPATRTRTRPGRRTFFVMGPGGEEYRLSRFGLTPEVVIAEQAEDIIAGLNYSIKDGESVQEFVKAEPDRVVWEDNRIVAVIRPTESGPKVVMLDGTEGGGL